MISGYFYEVCDCESICACWAEHEPDMGTCTGIFAWKVTGGMYTGSNVAVIFQGNDCSTAKNAIVYIDSASPNPTNLLRIFTENTHPWSQVIDLSNSNVFLPTVDIITATSISIYDDLDGNKFHISIRSSEGLVGAANFLIKNDGITLRPVRTGPGSLAGRAVGTSDVPIKVGLVSVMPSPVQQANDPLSGLNIFASTNPDPLGVDGYRFDIDITGVSAVRGQFTYAV